MKAEVKISKKSFKSEDGKKRYYNAIILEIGDREFPLFARADDKKLLNYLIDEEMTDEDEDEE